MNCTNRNIQMLLDEYTRGELSATDKSLVENHLAECESCRELLYDQRVMGAAVHEFVLAEAENHISSATMHRYAASPRTLGQEESDEIELHLLVCDSCRVLHEKLSKSEPAPGSWARLRQAAYDYVGDVFQPVLATVRRPAIAYPGGVGALLILTVVSLWILFPITAQLQFEKNVARTELTLADTPRSTPLVRTSHEDERTAAMFVMQTMLHGTDFEYERVSDTVAFRPSSGVRSPILRFTDSSGAVLDEFMSFAHDSSTADPSDWKTWILTLPSRDLYVVNIDSDTCTVIWPAEIERRGILVLTHKAGKERWPVLGKKFPTADPNTLLKRAQQSMSAGLYSTADTALTRAIEICRQEHVRKHDRVPLLYDLKSELRQRQGYAQEALSLKVLASQIRLSEFYSYAPGLTVTEVYDSSLQLRASRNALLSLYLSTDEKTPMHTREVADFCLAVKGIASEHERRLHHLIRRDPNMRVKKIASDLATDLVNMGSILANSPYTEGSLLGVETTHSEIDTILSRYRRLEEHLASEAGKFIQYKDDVTSRRMSECLPSNSIFIDYVFLEAPSSRYPQESSRYVAVVVDKYEQVWIVPLGHAAVIDSLAVALQRHMARIAQKSSWASSGDLAEYIKIARSLYRETIEPLENRIADEQLLIACPDGAMNLVPIDALVDGDDRYLIDRVALHYVSAGRELIFDETHRQQRPVKASGFMGVAGEGESTVVAGVGSRHSKDEINSVVESGTDTATLLFDSSATRAEFLHCAPRKRIIHMPLHGYTSSYLKDTLLGTWRLNTVDVPFDWDFMLTGVRLFDGVLRGSEITRLPLEGTEMAVLTMCKSSVGNQRPGEGNRGFAGAFRLAGVRTVIGALWDIPDESSSKMTPGLLADSEETIPVRLRREKLRQRQRLLNASPGMNDHPYYWAGLVSMGGW